MGRLRRNHSNGAFRVPLAGVPKRRTPGVPTALEDERGSLDFYRRTASSAAPEEDFAPYGAGTEAGSEDRGHVVVAPVGSGVRAAPRVTGPGCAVPRCWGRPAASGARRARRPARPEPYRW
ncbi:hypothetical protein GCM10010372_48270 [Streptomyces tauricus]|nr:hypothetical protein GCM10010372_48270 [Streptomyces tauricus]